MTSLLKEKFNKPMKHMTPEERAEYYREYYKIKRAEEGYVKKPYEPRPNNYYKRKVIKKETNINEGTSYSEYMKKAKEDNPKLYDSYRFGTFKNKDKIINKE